jgi:hypothetical protein
MLGFSIAKVWLIESSCSALSLVSKYEGRRCIVSKGFRQVPCIKHAPALANPAYFEPHLPQRFRYSPLTYIGFDSTRSPTREKIHEPLIVMV